MEMLCNPEGKLLPNDSLCECDDGEMKSSGGRHRKLSAPAQIAHIAAESMARMVRNIRRHSIIHHGAGGLNPSQGSYPMRSRIASVDEEGPIVLDEELKVPSEFNTGSLRSLRQITLTGTQVTSRGIRLLLHTSSTVSVMT